MISRMILFPLFCLLLSIYQTTSTTTITTSTTKAPMDCVNELNLTNTANITGPAGLEGSTVFFFNTSLNPPICSDYPITLSANIQTVTSFEKPLLVHYEYRLFSKLANSANNWTLLWENIVNLTIPINDGNFTFNLTRKLLDACLYNVSRASNPYDYSNTDLKIEIMYNLTDPINQTVDLNVSRILSIAETLSAQPKDLILNETNEIPTANGSVVVRLPIPAPPKTNSTSLKLKVHFSIENGTVSDTFFMGPNPCSTKNIKFKNFKNKEDYVTIFALTTNPFFFVTFQNPVDLHLLVETSYEDDGFDWGSLVSKWYFWVGLGVVLLLLCGIVVALIIRYRKKRIHSEYSPVETVDP